MTHIHKITHTITHIMTHKHNDAHNNTHTQRHTDTHNDTHSMTDTMTQTHTTHTMTHTLKDQKVVSLGSLKRHKPDIPMVTFPSPLNLERRKFKRSISLAFTI